MKNIVVRGSVRNHSECFLYHIILDVGVSQREIRRIAERDVVSSESARSSLRSSLSKPNQTLLKQHSYTNRSFPIP